MDPGAERISNILDGDRCAWGEPGFFIQRLHLIDQQLDSRMQRGKHASECVFGDTDFAEKLSLACCDQERHALDVNVGLGRQDVLQRRDRHGERTMRRHFPLKEVERIEMHAKDEVGEVACGKIVAAALAVLLDEGDGKSEGCADEGADQRL